MDKFTNKKITEEKLNEVAGGTLTPRKEPYEYIGKIRRVRPDKTYDVLLGDGTMILAWRHVRLGQDTELRNSNKVKVWMSLFRDNEGAIVAKL